MLGQVNLKMPNNVFDGGVGILVGNWAGVGHAIGVGHASDAIGVGHASDAVGVGHPIDAIGVGRKFYASWAVPSQCAHPIP